MVRNGDGGVPIMPQMDTCSLDQLALVCEEIARTQEQIVRNTVNQRALDGYDLGRFLSVTEALAKVTSRLLREVKELKGE